MEHVAGIVKTKDIGGIVMIQCTVFRYHVNHDQGVQGSHSNTPLHMCPPHALSEVVILRILDEKY